MEYGKSIFKKDEWYGDNLRCVGLYRGFSDRILS